MATIEKIKIEDLTTDQCHQFQKELCTWLSESEHNSKKAWPGWDKFDQVPFCKCFECVVDHARRAFTEPNCQPCHLEWSDDFNTPTRCMTSGPYPRWRSCLTTKKRKAVTKQLTELHPTFEKK